MTFAVGFITYHPGKNFFDRLELFSKKNIPVYVFDNSPEEKTLARKLQEQVIRYHSLGKNVGLGAGLSELAKLAYKDGVEGLLFLDQDTVFNEKTLNYIENFYLDKKEDLIEQRYVQVAYDARKSQYLGLQDAHVVINSGSLFLLPVLNQVGWHNKLFFVDGVDYELCLRANINNYKIGCVHNTPGFDHESEQPDVFIRVAGKRIVLRRYPYWRILDSLGAYRRMLVYCVRKKNLYWFGYVIRSLAIYITGQTLAYIFIRK